MKPGDSGVVTGYQVHEFTYIWLVEHFVAQSHIYPGFIRKVSSLIHYSFLDQTVTDFEQGLDSNLTNSIVTLEQDTLFEETDVAPSQCHEGSYAQLVPFLKLLLYSLLL